MLPARHVEVHAAQHLQLLVRLLQAPHADRRRRGCLGRHDRASPASRFGALDGGDQPFPRPIGDIPALRVVLSERLNELHGVVADDLADRRSIRRGLFEQIDKILELDATLSPSIGTKCIRYRSIASTAVR